MVETRPWGSFQVLDHGEFHKVKKLIVDPKKRISYQKHEKRIEYWTVVSGKGVLTLDGAERAIHLNDQVIVMPEALHRVKNTGKVPLVIIELQMGKELSEDDIVRVEDDYGRLAERPMAPVC